MPTLQCRLRGLTTRSDCLISATLPETFTQVASSFPARQHGDPVQSAAVGDSVEAALGQLFLPPDVHGPRPQQGSLVKLLALRSAANIQSLVSLALGRASEAQVQHAQACADLYVTEFVRLAASIFTPAH